MSKRIVVGSISHETNTFSSVPTKLADFKAQLDNEIVETHKGARTICSAFLKVSEEQGFKVPHFFGYMVYSGLILLPIFIIITLLFFRG